MPASKIKSVSRSRKFALKYAETLNATEAARHAGYTERSARTAGHRMLQKENVRALVKQELANAGLTSERTLREIAHIAYARPASLFDEHGKLRGIHEVDESTQAAIAQVEVVKKNLVSGDGQNDEVVRVKLWDKVRALELAAKHLRLVEAERPGAVQNVQIVVSWQNPYEEAVTARNSELDTVTVTAQLPGSKEGTDG